MLCGEYSANKIPLIGSGEPHAQESVGKAVDFCSALVMVGEELLVQEGADGVLDGAGGF